MQAHAAPPEGCSADGRQPIRHEGDPEPDAIGFWQHDGRMKVWAAYRRTALRPGPVERFTIDVDGETSAVAPGHDGGRDLAGILLAPTAASLDALRHGRILTVVAATGDRMRIPLDAAVPAIDAFRRCLHGETGAGGRGGHGGTGGGP